MEEVGQVPVTLKRELPGFVLNRMQYALIGEAWRLVTVNIDISSMYWLILKFYVYKMSLVAKTTTQIL